MKNIIIISILILSGCSFHEWNRTDKILYTGLVTATVADIAITEYGLDNGAEEKNPIFDGNSGLMIPVNLVALGIIYYLADKSPECRTWILGTTNVLRWGVVGWNINACRDF